jgi:hypothetical protein
MRGGLFDEPVRPFDGDPTGHKRHLPLVDGLRPRFDGATFDPIQDAERLTRQLDSVRQWMLSHGWQALAEISAGTSYPEASVSARLRDLRKPKFGGYVVHRRRRTAGTWEYRVRHGSVLGDAA